MDIIEIPQLAKPKTASFGMTVLYIEMEGRGFFAKAVHIQVKGFVSHQAGLITYVYLLKISYYSGSPEKALYINAGRNPATYNTSNFKPCKGDIIYLNSSYYALTGLRIRRLTYTHRAVPYVKVFRPFRAI